MAKPKLPSTGFFSNFTSPDTEFSEEEVSDANEEVEQEEEETEEEETSTEDNEEESEEQAEESSEEESEEEVEEDPFIATINHLQEKGILQFDEEHEYEEEGEELLEKVFSETLDKRFQEEYVDSIPEDYQSIIKHLKAGGSLEDWVDAVKTTDFDSINLEDESNQKQLIEDHLLSTGMDEEDVKDKVQEYEDAGTLEKNAKTALKYLKKSEENKIKEYEAELDKAVKAREKKQADDLEDFKKTVLSTEELKGFKLKDKKERQELLDYITKPANTKGESKYIQDSKSIENQLALAYMSMKGFSFKDLEKAVQTKAVSSLRKTLSKSVDLNAKSNGGKTGRVVTESKKIPKGPWG